MTLTAELVSHSVTFFLVSAPEGLWNTEQLKQLLSPLPDLLTQSPDFKREAQPMPWIELQKEVNLGKKGFQVLLLC